LLESYRLLGKLSTALENGSGSPNARWRIALFGGLRAEQAGKVHTNFELRKTGALLACLALFPHRTFSREVLAEELWPEEDPEAIRNRLRQALSTLRRVLESHEADEDCIVISGRNEVRLNIEAVSTDVMEFESALRSASQAANSDEHVRL